MTRSSVQYLVTIDGCPYAAGTAGCSASATSSDPDWPQGVTVLPGALSRESRLGWSEQLNPTTGESSFSSQSFKLDDVVPSSGDASGKRVWTWLFSRRPREMVKSPLTASITSSGTSITVSDGSAFPAGAQILWIGREAINVSGRVGNVFTVAVGGRGYLGTRALAHSLDAVNAFTPVAWASWPSPQRRRVILWMVEGTTATPLWRGYVGAAPRLDDSGARWELQCEHASTVHLNASLGPSRTAPRIAGFVPETFDLTILQTGFAGATVNRFSVLREPTTGAIPETLEQCLDVLLTALRQQLSLTGIGFSATVNAGVTEDGRARVNVRGNYRHTLSFGPRSPFATGPRMEPVPGEPYESVEASAGVFVSVRTTAYPVRAHVVLRTVGFNGIPLDSVASLPTTGLSYDVTDGNVTTRVQWVLTGTDPAGFPFHLLVMSVDTTNRRIEAVLRRSAPGRGRIPRGEILGDILLTEPTTVQLATVVESGHWLRAIQRGVLATDYGMDDQADPADWDWTNAADVVSATAGEHTSSRVWIFDGSMKLGEYLRDVLRLDGCALVTRSSRLAIVPLEPPTATAEPALTVDLTAGEGLHRRPPGWSTYREVVNSVQIKREPEDGPSVTVNNQSSIALFGLAPTMTIETKGALAENVTDRTPFEIARGPLSRLLGLWGSPAEVVQLDVPLARLTSVELGDIVAITSKVLPDGQGARGVSATRRGQVIQREIDFAGGVMRTSVLVYGADRGAGYAPAIRVASFSGAGNKTVTAATGYLTSVSTDDYAGSGLAGYPGTSGDGGVFHYAVGDQVKFRRVDDTSVTEEGGFTIDAVDPMTASVNISPDPALGMYDWVTLLAGGATIDLIADDYSNATTTQQGFAYVGDKATLTIDGTDAIQEWSP